VATNLYCEKLSLSVPRLEDVVAHDRRTKLFHLMVATLVEHGGPMTLEDIADRLLAVGVTARDGNLKLALQRAWHGREPVYRLPEGAFALDLKSHELDLILYMTGVRPPGSRPAPLSESATAVKGLFTRPKTPPKVAVLRAVPTDSRPQAASVLDPEAHSVTTLTGEAMTELPAQLNRYDFLVGLQVRPALHLLGLDPSRWELEDLGTVRKTIRINRSRRTLRVTPEMLIAASTGISRPLGEPRKIAAYLATNQRTRLVRRLESDVKALHAFYRYGVLHRWVRLRWGFLDEMLPVWWGPRGAEDLETILTRAASTGAAVELVVGSAPGWEDPWRRAQRGAVVGIGEWDVRLCWGAEEWPVDRYAIQAVRLVGA
jgi:hypothetical protein